MNDSTACGIIQTVLLPYQRHWVNDNSRFKIGLWARQTGKDFSAMAEAVLDCVERPNKFWIVIAAGERQALESLEKGRQWSERLLDAGAIYLTGQPIQCEISANEIKFSNGSRILALPAKAETVRGYSANLILTEFAFHENPDEIWRALYPTISNSMQGGHKLLRIISTPNGSGNKFHELWTSGQNFSRHRITIHQAVAQHLQVKIDELRAGLGDTAGWEQEYECEFRDNGTPLLSQELITSCEDPNASESGRLGGGRTCVGIDFGRTKQTVCWTLERQENLFFTREVLVLTGMSTPDQLNVLRPRIRRASLSCIDATGPGIGLADLLEREFGRFEKGGSGKVELCRFDQNLKAEIMEKLCLAMQERKIRIPSSPDIRQDLNAMQRSYNDSGAAIYRAKVTASGHSDRCVALALAWRAARFAPRPFQWSPVYDRPRFPKPVWCL
jgi:phage FluMu gp28-like protein